MSESQSQNGKAFEYALAKVLSRLTGIKPTQDKYFTKAQKDFYKLSICKKKRMRIAARNAIGFLIKHDRQFKKISSICISGDKAGEGGDVRDIIITCTKGEVGISAKHNHEAAKHPRLSNEIDFGKKWGNQPVSDQYWKRIKPVFDDLRKRQTKGELFRDIPDKLSTVYLPVLSAFEDELSLLCKTHGRKFVRQFFQHLIGRYDFYKIICLSDEVIIESFNINGSLGWGKRVKIPNRVEKINMKPKSKTTVLVTFEGGWQIKFRLHNADKKIEPSLKFDINFKDKPPEITKHTISHQLEKRKKLNQYFLFSFLCFLLFMFVLLFLQR